MLDALFSPVFGLFLRSLRRRRLRLALRLLVHRGGLCLGDCGKNGGGKEVGSGGVAEGISEDHVQ